MIDLFHGQEKDKKSHQSSLAGWQWQLSCEYIGLGALAYLMDFVFVTSRVWTRE